MTMTAREYLESHLRDEYPEASSIQTQTALCAYALGILQEVDGYSIDDAEKTIKDCNIKDRDFIKRCLDFISNAQSAYEYIKRIPSLDDIES